MGVEPWDQRCDHLDQLGAMKKGAPNGCLGYIGDENPTQLCGDYFINHYKDAYETTKFSKWLLNGTLQIQTFVGSSPSKVNNPE